MAKHRDREPRPKAGLGTWLCVGLSIVGIAFFIWVATQ